MFDQENPLLSPSPLAWQRLIEAVDPAGLLVVIDRRMGAGLRAEHSAEDILQEALLHAWRGRSKCEWRGIRAFRSWLLSIIDHRIQDLADRATAAKRSNGRAVLTLSAFDPAQTTTPPDEAMLPAGSTTPSRLAIYREQADAMEAALAQLPGELREVVRLRLFEQCPLEEIAARQGLGVSAVRHRFRKGSELYVRMLRSALTSRSRITGTAAELPRESSSQEEPPLRA